MTQKTELRARAPEERPRFLSDTVSVNPEAEITLRGPFHGGEEADYLNASFLQACGIGLRQAGWGVKLVVINTVEAEIPLP